MQVLKALSHKNITILAVIHQPRWAVFKAFDKLLLLKKGGNLVYYGPTATATEFFNAQGYEIPAGENINPADWYLDSNIFLTFAHILISFTIMFFESWVGWLRRKKVMIRPKCPRSTIQSKKMSK